jgi:hypothetical protein
MSKPDTAPSVRDAAPDSSLRRHRQAEGRRQAVTHSGQGRARRDPQEARVDPRPGRLRRHTLLRDQGHPAQEQAGDRLRGSLLPQHRRVFRQGHGHLHDHGRQVHAPLPVLRCRPWPARPARCERTSEPGQHHRQPGLALRGDHQCGPRRSARRRQPAFCRLHPADPCVVACHPHRDPGARLPGARRPRAGDPQGRPARRDEPQPGNRAAPVP